MNTAKKSKVETKVESRKSKPKSKVVRKTESRIIKTSEAHLKANAKYESQFKRINCRIPPETWERMTATGKSANSLILEALEKYLSE